MLRGLLSGRRDSASDEVAPRRTHTARGAAAPAAAVATSGAAAGEADLVSNVVDIIFAGGANTSGLVHVSLSLDIAPLAFGGDGCVVPTILGVVFGGQARV